MQVDEDLAEADVMEDEDGADGESEGDFSKDKMVKAKKPKWASGAAAAKKKAAGAGAGAAKGKAAKK